MTDKNVKTFALEPYIKRNFNYLTRMVDGDNLPYFNIFWTDPAEAAHDWPDFGDVMSRQLQAAIMARYATGEDVSIEKIWYEKVLGLLNPETGLLARPSTNYSEPVWTMGDQALTLYALVTAYADNADPELEQKIHTMVDTLRAYAQGESGDDTQPADGFVSGFIIKSLMVCARMMGYEPALDLARTMVTRVFEQSTLFAPDNTFRHGGHMHGNLRTLVGAADYALTVGDPVLYSRVDALYRYVRSETTGFGFLPEAIGRKGDIVSCETCAIMDYLGLAVTLANHGHPEYWGDVERMIRNHLIESQVKDGSWLKSGPARPDTDQFTWRDVGERMVGGYAGWSAPNHILAARETLDAHWGGPELHGKTRAFQNCCGGSGTHAFFIAWKNTARLSGGTLSVNMHIDKLLPQAEIRCYQPYEGLLTVSLREPCNVRVRIPEFVAPDAVRATSSTGGIDARIWGNYLELGPRQAGETIRVTYPVRTTAEEISIGNPGCRQYHYRVTWKGDTVVKMEPLGNDYETGYSDFDQRQVPIFYGEEGPGPLYLRDHMLGTTVPELSSLHEDEGHLDFWHVDI